MTDLFRYAATPIMLVLSNVFMTTAWYGHLKFKWAPLWIVILTSWAIALVEYCLAVPANRWGSAVYSTAQLKTMQEVITLVVFVGFSALYLGEGVTWRHALGFALIALGASAASRRGSVAAPSVCGFAASTFPVNGGGLARMSRLVLMTFRGSTLMVRRLSN